MMKTNEMIQRIKKTVTENKLISEGDRVLVALSGGADSVFLLHALKVLSYNVSACHVEHGIRGEDALNDCLFSRQLCESMGIEFFSKSFDVPAIAMNDKISVEAAGRKVRYEYFQDLCNEHGFTKIATAHHRDDKVETVVMNMIRGCGLRGFTGIEYKNNNIIRPLLDVTKDEILDYLKENYISYCTDITNNDLQYTRNRIRHSLIPSICEYNPSFNENIIRQSKIFSEEDDYMTGVAMKASDNCLNNEGIVLQKFLSLHTAIQRRVMYMYLARSKGTKCDISYADVEAALLLCKSGETGKKRHLSSGVTVGVSYGVFSVKEDARFNKFKYSLEFDIPVEIKEIGLRVTLHSSGGNLNINPGDSVVIRSRADGDYFYPMGMTGKKKLKDFFTDKKIPRDERDLIPILTVNGDVASVVGIRDDRRFCDCGGDSHLLIETI